MKKLTLLVVAVSLLPFTYALAAGPVPTATATKEAKPLGQLIEDLGSTDWQVRRDASIELSQTDSETLGAVIPLLTSKNANARCGACEEIREMTRRISDPSN